MPPYVYYDRRTVSSTETQFFHESRTKHPDKEIGTNMEKDSQFPEDVRITRIAVVLPPQILSSTTAKDTSILDQIKILLNEAIMQIQVGRGDIYYLPVVAALANPNVVADLEYTLGTAADGSYAFANVSAGNGHFGLDVDIPVPANTDFKFFLKTKTTPSFGTVTVLLFVERGAR